MYRLLIIDDEPYIVDWVYELFQQHGELELDIYKAYSGLEALGLLRRAKIDIVLTDIQMPDMNGIELLKEIRASWPMCKVIFLTAHDEFEYAHAANKDGVTYLLKTEGDAEIIKAVEKAVKEIDNHIRQEELVRNARKQMEKTLPIMQREYLLEKLEGKYSAQIDQEQLDDLGINLLAQDELLILIGRSDDWFLSRQATDRARQSAVIQTVAQSFFFPVVKYAYLKYDSSILVWIIQPQKDARDSIISGELWEKTIVYVKGSLDSIQDQCKKSLGTTCSFVMDSEPCTWETMAQKFSSLLLLLNYSGINNKGMILTSLPNSDDGIDRPEQFHFRLRQVTLWMDKLHTLDAYLGSGQRKEFRDLFGELKENLIPILKMHPSLGIEVYFSISLMFLTYINRYEALLEKLPTQPELANLMNISSGMPCEEAFDSFEKAADTIFLYQKDDRETKDNILVSGLHEYIHSNLDKDVSLVKLAELVYLNPAYLSRVYKQITGTNISDYIYNTRLSKAKKILRESNSKVQEIALAVGFESVAYFIRSFKKSTGMTPQEYRENLKT
jgi:two-component system response regulator YesN